MPDFPTLRGLRSIPRIKWHSHERPALVLDHDALREVRTLERKIKAMRQEQARLMLPMYRAGVTTYVLSRMTGITQSAVLPIMRRSDTLAPDTWLGPDLANDDGYLDEDE